MPAPASSTNDAAICVTANSRSRRLVPDVMRTLPLDRPSPLDASADGQPRNEGQQHRRDERERDADPEQARVDGQVERANREARRVPRQHRRPSAARSATPRMAPAPQSSRLSASSVRRSAPALAPSAARIASSPSRRTERARIRLATFEHAMTKTSAEAASSTSSTVRAGDDDLIAQADGVDAEVRRSSDTPRDAP